LMLLPKQLWRLRIELLWLGVLRILLLLWILLLLLLLWILLLMILRLRLRLLLLRRLALLRLLLLLLMLLQLLWGWGWMRLLLLRLRWRRMLDIWHWRLPWVVLLWLGRNSLLWHLKQRLLRRTTILTLILIEWEVGRPLLRWGLGVEVLCRRDLTLLWRILSLAGMCRVSTCLG